MIYDYLCEIKDIARVNHAGSFSDAVDMFLNNVKDVGNPNDQYFYDGAVVDYAALKPSLDVLTEGKPGIVAFHQKHIEKINELYLAGKRDELRSFVSANR